MKKLATILALTGVVANLGFATVFADDATGTQDIGCNGGAGPSLSAPANLGFYGRSTQFTNELDANLENPSLAPSLVTVTDLRGYDVAAGDCGAGFSLAVQSDGLVQGNYTIHLGTGSFDNSDLSEDTTVSTSFPDTLIGPVVTTTIASVDQEIAGGGVELMSATEAFYGDVTLALNSSDADNTTGALNNNTVLKARHDKLEDAGGAYAGPIPAGSYIGTITFTLS